MATHATQAVLLLTARFSRPAAGDPRPLTPTEWGRFALWLKEQGLTPEALLAADPSGLLAGWRDEKAPAERILALLARSPALALALEKWQRAGLWVVTRSDPDYPARLKKHLKNSSPPLFFGCGNRQLLNRGGLAVVGSRNAAPGDLDFARRLGGDAAAEGCSIISGGARGIDESAMSGALEKEGTVVGVLADRLLAAATSAKYRPALMARNLVLVSPFNPETGFDVGNAMARNKYVYCLADAAVIVHSGTKGGTWSGALETLKQGWVPVWVKPTEDPQAGNAGLVAKGARRLPEKLGEFGIRDLFERQGRAEPPPRPGDLFDTTRAAAKAAAAEYRRGSGPEDLPGAAAVPDPSVEAASLPGPGPSGAAGSGIEVAGFAAEEIRRAAADDEREVFDTMSFYEMFLRRMQTLTAKEAQTVEQLLAELDVSKAQLNEWLKRATAEGKLSKKKAPVRYAWRVPEPKPEQASIF